MQSGELRFEQIEFGSEDYQQAVSLRDAVLRKPLGLHYTKEQLEAEQDSWHLVCKMGKIIVGSVILKPETDKVIRMRQFAVQEDLQGQGIGRFLSENCEQMAKQAGYSEMLLHARESVIPFYQKLGFQSEGDRFLEVTLPHYKMRKPL